MTTVRYTEMFKSVQGEALHTGEVCTWLRLFACSLQCRGFGQKEPGNPETWEEQRPNIIVKEYTQLEQVPTPHVGCDSDYSWSAKFKHLIKKATPVEIAIQIKSMTRNGFNDKIGHIFTGGEPLMQQDAIGDIINEWIWMSDTPKWIGFETNGTQPLNSYLTMTLDKFVEDYSTVYFSISPKLLHVAGEQPEKAIKMDVIESYLGEFPDSYLKFVLNEDPRAWHQAECIVRHLNSNGLYPDVWVMPVGGLPGQQLSDATGRIADKAIFEYEWNVSPRVHLMIWGDEQIGR